MPSKGEIISNVLVEHFAAEGKCITRIDGIAVFIEGVVPGDHIDLKIIRKKKNYLEGRVERIVTLSDDHVEPFCDHFGLCGGCKWQNLAYSKQAKYKEQQVRDNIERIGKIDNPKVSPVLMASQSKYYRNKLEFTFSTNKWLTSEQIASGAQFDRRALGFHVPKRFDKIVDIDLCYLQREPSNQIRNALKDFALENELGFYDINQQHGFLRNLIIRTTSIDELMVIVQFGSGDEKPIESVMSFLANSFTEITSLYYVVNEKKNETFFDLPVKLYKGKPVIEEKIGHIKYQIGPKSFFQTNTEQALVLYQKAKEMAALEGTEVLYDLYTGAGTIANFFADSVAQVIGIDSIPEAIEDAKVNATRNDINNTIFIAGDIKDTFNEELIAEYGRPDILITDPPRAGMHQNVIKQILKMMPRRIIYISCNPATQARDLELLKESYAVEEIQPIDMFPHTHHIENIVDLNLK
jgi:23S rRNA (uracil1939-C5)-methyltransferase